MVDKLTKQKEEMAKFQEAEIELYTQAKMLLDQQLRLLSSGLTLEERNRLHPLCLLTLKPVVYIINISEDNVDGAIRKWLAIGKDTYPGAMKSKNVTRKGKQ